MPSNKDNKKGASRSSMGDSSMDNMSDRDFESQGQGQGRTTGGQGGNSGGYGKDTGMQGNMSDDEMNTAGGREGQFSDKNREGQNQWSPGASGGSSDE